MKKLFCMLLVIYGTKSVNAQVNLQTGAAEQSFPLINYTDSKAGLSLGVGLGYSSGNGLLVNDIASDVGTGWNLDAGGMITRVQIGEPDDQPENTGQLAAYSNDIFGVKAVLKRYPNGYMYNPNIGKGCNAGLNYLSQWRQKYAVYKERNIVAGDVEQDKFIFRVNGRTGMFVIPRNWQSTMEATIIGDAKIKISFSTANLRNQGIRTTIDQFLITTEDGIKYTFSDKSLTWICRYKQSFRDALGRWHEGREYNDNAYEVNYFLGYNLDLNEKPFVVNSWYLSKIENPNTGQQITFNYETVQTDFISSKYISHHRKLNEAQLSYFSGAAYGRSRFTYLYSNGTGTNANDYTWDLNKLGRLTAGGTSVFYNRASSFSKRISEIILPNGGNIKFKYSSKERIDLKGEHALEDITYFLNNKIIRQYHLSYNYFFRNALRGYDYNFYESEKAFARLCLSAIQKMGNSEDNANEPPYRFSYYLGGAGIGDDIVPARNFLSQDHWGYYNGSNSHLPLSINHDLLSRGIDYFIAVLPINKNPKPGYARNGLLKQVIYPTGGILTYSYEQIKASTAVLPASQGMPNAAGGVAVSKTELKDAGTAGLIEHDYIYVKPGQTTSSHWGDEAPSYYSFNIYENSLHCSYGFGSGGRNTFKYPGVLYPERATTVEGGMNLGAILASTAFSMGLTEVLKAIIGEGVIPVLNFIGASMLVINIINIISACEADLDRYDFYISNTNNTMSNPLPSYFSSVEVRENSSAAVNGRTVYEFTSPADYPVLVSQNVWPYIPYQRLADWQYGNPGKITVYDKDNHIVSETNNIYNSIISPLPDMATSSTGVQVPANLNCKCATINKEVMRSDDWEAGANTWFSMNPIRWMTPTKYKYFTGRTDLASTFQKQYSNGQLYSSDQIRYISDPATLLQKGKITYGDANTLIFDINYMPTDYNIPGSAIQTLKDNNAIHVPVSTEKWMLGWQTTPGPNPVREYTYYLLSSNVTEYKKYTIGGRVEVKPYLTYALKTNRPLPIATIGLFDPTQLIRNPQYYKVQSEMTYDAGGNLVKTTEDGNSTSFVNDHNDRYVTASVANAEPADIAFSSFETNGKGNWTFNLAGVSTDAGLTGSQSYQVSPSNSISKSGLNTAKNYVITYWLKDEVGSAITVNSQSATLVYQANGWKLYKKIIAASSGVTISGSGTIDELRLYPEHALMSTVTYKEGIGKIADCDANNRILFYEYDALSRLKLIRDQNKNIIKTYEYNYKK